MKVLYFTRGFTTHDKRFLTSLSKTDNNILFLRLENRINDSPIPDLPGNIEHIQWVGDQTTFRWKNFPDLFEGLSQILDIHKPDLVHAGPLQTCAFMTASTGFQPLLSMSWGYDLLLDANRNSFYSSATKFTLKNSSAFVGDCQTVKKEAINFGMSEKRIVTFPWGINLDRFDNTKPKLPTENFTIISTRAWEPMYGTDVIAKAFVQAAREIPELRMLMLGSGSQKNYIIQIFEQGGCLDRVEFPGVIDENELPEYYARANLYVAASISDGTSISLLEAMASGLPVIVSQIPGNQEWVFPEKNGWLFPTGDYKKLSELIAKSIINRNSLESIGSVGQKIAREKADWNKNIFKLQDAYQIAVNFNVH